MSAVRTRPSPHIAPAALVRTLTTTAMPARIAIGDITITTTGITATRGAPTG